MLNPSLLLTLFMTPTLKYFSSPAAVRPPIYHLSDPLTSLKPSLLLSLPRRRLGPGIGTPPRGERTPGERDCGGCDCEGMDLGAEPADGVVDVEGAPFAAVVGDVEVGGLLGCWWAGRCWRMEEKKVERKNGRCEDIVGMWRRRRRRGASLDFWLGRWLRWLQSCRRLYGNVGKVWPCSSAPVRGPQAILIREQYRGGYRGVLSPSVN